MKRATLDFETHNSALERVIERPWFRHLVIALIIVNAVILGVLTYRETLPAGLVVSLDAVDQTITYVFAVEILLKLVVYRLQFFRRGWNWFDFIVIGVSLIPGTQAFGVLRALRVLRILRLLHIVPMMRRITEALMKALPGMGAIFAVLALITYVAAVMATNMYGNTENEEVTELFGDLPRSAYSLFQVMTMDGWRFEVVQKVIDDGNPYAWMFFLIFIFIASFAILNLFIALIVDSLAAEQQAIIEEGLDEIEGELEGELMTAEKERAAVLSAIQEMRSEIAALRASVEAQSK
ncbi:MULTISPECIES: ion transporter [unclassified Hyphomonas]|jgi:voltage-gated sodium channel|uniref:ion transporter n=2 Tax=Hyphomonas TaxID=85 RepID=UPI000C890CEA|nr:MULTISPECIES: ion transporter [unclassified Hyphomonas]MAL44936.1 voltage-gated sodium channel [Hyphomonas sp.]HAW56862.1 voltage-gated sodium channel [Hyphomonas sp.]HBJ39647.1 voltage-gated sodium channel [Hyphomonas sp.]HBN94432.1 voltage-gated sodium channel [Hyphomonas sp.]HBT34742.1 voltage-gated sodium channel [Hyphomonas sp.]|tara:strand:- start:3254 stop:4135 length:882 start_codon:yes stop_codon:yes gene_type:complete